MLGAPGPSATWKSLPMLDAMRRGAVNWLAKILLGLLIVAFAIWGVADVFRGYGRGTLARIGKTEISVEEYRQAYNEEVAAISRRMGRSLTTEQAKLLGLEHRALSRLIGAAAVDAHAHELRLSLSDKGIADIIREDSAFRDATGAFSNQVFHNYLRQNGMPEGRYVETRRKEEVREQLTDTLLGTVAVPQLLIDLLHRFGQETRVIEFFTPDYDKVIKIAEPDESKLKEYYDQNKRQFMTPELRKVNVLLLTRGDAKARLAPSEEDVKAAYDRDKEKFNVPEKRRIQQLSFADRAAADKAYAELAKAKNFKEAVATLGFKDSDIELGLLARTDLIDAKIAEAAFGLKKNELSKPVEGQFAIVLLRVGEIVPGKQRTFEDVKGEIRDRLADERVNKELHDLHEKIEDERSSGKSLREIADGLKLPFRDIAEIDRNANTGAGKPALEIAEAAKIAQAAFSGTAGIEAEATDLGDGGYAWVDVLAVTAEKQKPFEEVKDQAKTATIEQERRKEIAVFASKLVERLAAGETMEALAKETGAKVEKSDPVIRTAPPPALPQNALQQAFALPKGGATSALTADGKARIILRVADVIAAPPPTQEQTDRLKGELARQLQTDLFAEYIGGLQTRYGLSVNDAALKQALGPEREQPELE